MPEPIAPPIKVGREPFGRGTWDVRMLRCDSHGSLQLDEVRAAGRHNERHIDELSVQQLDLLQGVRRSCAKLGQDCEILVALLLREGNLPSDKVPDKTSELRCRGEGLVLLMLPKQAQPLRHGVHILKSVGVGSVCWFALIIS